MIPKIIFQDYDLLVLDKPAGLVVDRSETQQGHTLEDWLQKRHPRSNRGSINNIDIDSRFHPKGTSHFVEARGNDKLERQGIVHRLDKDTSGLILVAKTTQALENLQSQFQTRIVKKEYLALVHGFINEPGKIEGDIGRNPGDRSKFTVLQEGKKAVTEYKPMERLQLSGDRLQEIFPDFNKIQRDKLEKQRYVEFTLVRCYPLTGRTHQIRVHLKYAGYPIMGDEKYVGRKVYRLDHRWCPRQFLHAAKLKFNHPLTGKKLEFESPLPDDLKKVLATLEQ